MKKFWVRRFLFLFLLVVLGVLGGCFLFAPPGVPENVTASDGEYSEYVLVSWSAVRRATTYEVFRATAEDGDYEKLGETPSPSFQDTTASPNVLYWYRVRAANQFGTSAFSQADSGYRLGAVAPTAPTNVQASDGTFCDLIKITWSTSLGATHYQVYRADLPGVEFILIADRVSATSYEDLQIAGGRTYWYKVKACNDYGCSDFSSADSGSTTAQVLGAPQNVRASDGTYSDRVRVSWNAMAEAATYEVHRAFSRDGIYELLALVTGTSYDDTAVAQGRTYWYKVRALSPLGCGPFSEPDSGYASSAGGGDGGDGAVLPGFPRNLTATDGAHEDKIVITWSAASGARRYEIWRAGANGATEPAEDAYELIAETTSTSYTDTEPGLCELYWYKVRGWNENGFGPWAFPDSGYTGATLGTVDASKIKAVVLPDGAYRVYLEWPHVKNAEKYRVVYEIWRRGSAGPFALIGETEPPDIYDPDDPRTYTYVDEAVMSGSTYYYKIRARSEDYQHLLLPDDGPCSECGECLLPGGFSGEVGVVVTCNPLPPELKTVRYDQNEEEVTLIWTNPYAGTPVEDAVSFEIWRSTSANTGYELHDEVGPGDITDDEENVTYQDADFSDLESGETYTLYYRVKACFDCGCGVFSNAKSVRLTVH